MDVGALVASVLASVATVGGGYLVARRFQKLGGGAAQDRLNKIREEVAKAAEERVDQLEEQFQGCKVRLVEVEGTVRKLEDDAAAAAKRWSRERIDLKQEITDLHHELRKLRTDRRGAADRSDD